MTSKDTQPTLITALQQAAAYPHPTNNITLIETHISWVLLTGEVVYKIKKPVDFGFLDFSTLEKRRHYCAEECRLNARLAPQLYLGVIPICGTPESPQVDGTGAAFEYAVKMRQFDPQQAFDELLARKALTLSIIDETATVLAKFHQQIEIASAEDTFGTPNSIEQPVQENFAQIRQALSETKSNTDEISEACEGLQQWSLAQHKKLQPIFLQRKQAGFIRECHGDLHLRNIMLWENHVTPFDGIEFNANLRWIDVVSELAFLLMDLDDHQQEKLSRRLLNRYLSLTGYYQGLATLRYYQVYRAMVRAKVAALRLAQVSDPHECLIEVHNYVELAKTYTKVQQTKIIITHGLSGSGKSFLAQQLLLETELIHLRSDVERKRLFGLNENQHSDSKLDNGIYQQGATEATYKRLCDLTELCINSGFSVIVDATFLQHAQRSLFASLAQQLDCAYVILDCQAEIPILQQRIQQREQQGNDASEANLAVLEKQCQSQQPLSKEELKHTLPVATHNKPDIAKLVGALQQ